MADDQTIVVKKIIAGEHAHHGGSWKVAFADFAMAMMAFFLIMWLMGATTADQKGGISQYFKNPSVVQGASPLPSPSSIQGPGGHSSSMIQSGGSMELFKDPPSDKRPSEKDPDYSAAGTNTKDGTKDHDGDRDADGQAAEAEAAAVDTERLGGLMLDLKAAVQQKVALKPFADQLLMDLTAEGLRIQMIDKESSSMFPSGSAELEPYSFALLRELAGIVKSVPNRISISGHTDGRNFSRNGRGNWELSAERANAARRALVAGGLPEDKIGRVVGLSSFAPLDPGNLNNPTNRRISIIVLNQRTENAIRQESGALFSVQTNLEQETSSVGPAGQ
jgi:chemotaxis protein MotB